MSIDPEDSARLRDALTAFFERLEKDRGASWRPTLREYLDLFRGFEDEVAEEYLRPEKDVGSTPSASSPAPGAPAPRAADTDRFGPYRLLQELGRGGQGVVYKAEDTRLGRSVALKMLAPGHDSNAGEFLRRFKREAEAASRLDHPGICAVYDAGSQDGVPFIAMRYVPGETLGRKIAAARQRLIEDGTHRLELGTVEVDGDGDLATVKLGDGERRGSDPGTFMEDMEAEAKGTTPTAPIDASVMQRDAATDDSRSTVRGTGSRRADVMSVVHLVEQIARALQVAHEAGVVHRDIKPGNIMIPQSGPPVILDFGLARGEFVDVTLTRTGELFGTLPYMAPEQLQERDVGSDPRIDVYALGVSLYECLALRRPFEAPTQEGLLRTIIDRDPVPLRRINAAVPRDLEVVVATALEKEPERRYRTAAAFAEELRRVREREPIISRPAGPVLRTWRWAQRNPALAASLLVILVLLFAWIGVLLSGIAREKEERQRATRRFEEGRRLARAFFEDVYDEVLDLPGATRARELMVKAALRYLDGLKDDAADQAALQDELLRGYIRVARVQGDPAASNLGDYTGALTSLSNARDVLDAMRAAAPDDLFLQTRAIDLVLRECEVLRTLGRVAEAEQGSQGVVATAKALEGRLEPELQAPLVAQCLLGWSRCLLDLGKLAEARARIDDARALAHPERDRKLVLAAQEQLAEIAVRTGNARDATAHLEGLLAEARRRLVPAPHSVGARREIAQRLVALASLDEQVVGTRRALEYMKESIAITDELVRADAIDLRSRRDLVHARLAHARLLMVAGSAAAARSEARAALGLAEEIEAVDPGNRSFSVRLGNAMSEFGETLLWTGEVRDAHDYLARALDLLKKHVPEDGSAGWQPMKFLANAWRRVGNVHFQQDEMTEARRHYQKGAAILRDAVSGVPQEKLRIDLANAVDEVGDTFMGSHEHEKALERFREAMGIRQQLLDGDPDNLVFVRNLGISHYNVGRALAETGQSEDALSHLRKSLDCDRRMIAADPSNRELVENLAISEYKVGRMLTDDGRLDDGRPLLQSAVDRLEALMAEDPGNIRYARDFVPCAQALGVCCARARDWEPAIAVSVRLVEVLDALRESDGKATWYAKERRLCLQRLAQIARVRGREAEEARWNLTLLRADADLPDATTESLIEVATRLVASTTAEGLRDSDAAIGYATRAVALTKRKDPSALVALAEALAAAKRPKEAVAALAEALALVPAGTPRHARLQERLAELRAGLDG